MWRLQGAVALSALVLASEAAPVAVVPWPQPSSQPLNVTLGYGTVRSTGTRFNWYTATLDDLSWFSIQLPPLGCKVREKTSSTAKFHGCKVAANAGYFQFYPKPTFCLGHIVIDSKIAQWSSDSNPMMGVTADRKTVIGSFTQQEVESLNITYAVSAFGVVVQDGRPSLEGIESARRGVKALRSGAEEIAPRTALAVDHQGRLVVIAIDGAEALKLGLTMDELAEVLAEGAPGFDFQALHAVNMDGGGSTTMAASFAPLEPAAVYNRPATNDMGPIGERRVTSIVCIKEPKAEEKVVV